MSLAVNPNKIEYALLPDGWHSVVSGSFDIDSYEYVDGDFVLLGGGRCEGVPSTGFSFVEYAEDERRSFRISGPLTALLAVRGPSER